MSPSPTARALMARLVAEWDWPDPALLEEILALGPAAVPALAELLTPERLATTREGAAADAVVYYSAHLLSEIGTPAVLPILLKVYRKVDTELQEGLQDALLRLGPEALELAGAAGGRLLSPPDFRPSVKPPPFVEQYRAQHREHLAEQEAARQAQAAASPLGPVFLSPRIGRNDLCWCGSGFKYKKCHLAQDEKEKSRL